MEQLPSAESSADAALEPYQTLHLRLLATSDLHMQVTDHDYIADQRRPGIGLTRLSGLIQKARQDVPNCLLLDNGDFLQGTLMGDWSVKGKKANPMIAAMNALAYDAITLGNHEFTHGLPYLKKILEEARFPIVSANLCCADTGKPFVPPSALLVRDLTGPNGQRHLLRIGVTGVLPPQTARWDAQAIKGKVLFDPMIEAVERAVSALRSEGADVVIVLAHCGAGDGKREPTVENAGLAIAALQGVDAIVLGHLHTLFPDASLPATEGIDPVRGCLHGKPAVMPGHSGSHLGVIDLTLVQTAHGWRVNGHRTALWSATEAPTSETDDGPIRKLLAPAHRATRTWARRKVGQLDQPLNSFFVMLGDMRAMQILHQVKIAHAKAALAAGPWAGLPVLAATAAFRAGGRGGPDNFADVPAGVFERRHGFALYPPPNRLMALLVTGEDLLHWLNQAARVFHKIIPGEQDQPLLRTDLPSFLFDTIGGLTYRVDLSAPEGARITDLRYAGKPIDLLANFVLATNSYRAHAPGAFLRQGRGEFILKDQPCVRDLLMHHLSGAEPVSFPLAPGWQFAPLPGTSVLCDTGPGALAHLDDIAHLKPEPIGLTPDGFLRLRLWL